MPHSEAAWRTWYDVNEDGEITSAGVDAVDRNVCMTCAFDADAGPQVDDKDVYNESVVGDTELLGTAKEMRELLVDLRSFFVDVSPGYWPMCVRPLLDRLDGLLHKSRGEAALQKIRSGEWNGKYDQTIVETKPG